MDQAGELLLQLLHVGAQGLEVIDLDLTLLLVDDPGKPSLVSAVLFMIEAESLFLLSFFLTVLVCLKRAISFYFIFL